MLSESYIIICVIIIGLFMIKNDIVYSYSDRKPESFFVRPSFCVGVQIPVPFSYVKML